MKVNSQQPPETNLHCLVALQCWRDVQVVGPGVPVWVLRLLFKGCNSTVLFVLCSKALYCVASKRADREAAPRVVSIALPAPQI